MQDRTSEKACKICGEWFEPSVNAAVYCSDWCREQGEKMHKSHNKGKYDYCIICGTEIEGGANKYCPIHSTKDKKDDSKNWIDKKNTYKDYLDDAGYPDFITEQYE